MMHPAGLWIVASARAGGFAGGCQCSVQRRLRTWRCPSTGALSLPAMNPGGAQAPAVLWSEDDVRSKVVMSWLASHGFTPAEIAIEFSFELRVGRGVLRVGDGADATTPVTRALRPRTDVLVRHVDGRNLLVVEVKAPGEPLDDDAREQGISYARLLREGGIAPFVVLTDGTRSRIFDSISGDELRDEAVPGDHPHARNRFRVTGDNADLRAQALEKLVSLDPANLLAFCRAQVEFRMRKLRDTDPQSGRKYISSLYVERPQAQRHLDQLIADGKRVVLVVGPPQVGKTNLVCHTVEQRLERGEPTLFYPAITVGALAAELRDDFEWSFRQDAGSEALSADRLARIARASGRRLIIFVDGWNEAATDTARSIDAAAERIASDDITFVISLTNVAARRLLTDSVGDPGFVADEAGIPVRDIVLLDLSKPNLPRGWSVVELGEYDDAERRTAYERYSGALVVAIPANHRHTNQPLLLRMAMISCTGATLPVALDEPEFLRIQVDAKLQRTRLDPSTARIMLIDAAHDLLECGAPAREDRLLRRWGIPLSDGVPTGLFDSALLVRRAEEHHGGVDFYFQRERDFVTAYWACDWARSLADPLRRRAELERCSESDTGLSALNWFLAAPLNSDLLNELFLEFSTTAAEPIRRFLMQHAQHVILSSSGDLEAVELRVRTGLRDPVNELRLQSVEALEQLIGRFPERDRLRLIGDPLLIADLLRLDSLYPLQVDTAGNTVLRALRFMHNFDDESHEDALHQQSGLSELLSRFAEHGPLQGSAIKAFAYVAPLPFFRWLAPRLPVAESERGMVEQGVANAVERIRELLYWEFNREGGWADVLIPGGWLEDDSDGIAEARRERARFHRLFEADLSPVIHARPESPHAQELKEFLADLATDAAVRPDPYDPGYQVFLKSLKERVRQTRPEDAGQTTLALDGEPPSRLVP
jgi:hypothetical protein